MEGSATNDDFLVKIFGNGVGHKEPLIINGVEHKWISCGSTRDVYVDPTLSYVIKKNNDSYSPHSGNQFNAIEVWDYWYTRLDNIPKVKTTLFRANEGEILIMQDFLIVMNVARHRINPIFKDVFQPEDSHITDIYGYQYGWNKRTGRIELYDTSDMYLGRSFINNAFEDSYDWMDIKFRNFDAFANIHFYDSFVEWCTAKGLWSHIVNLKKHPECYLLHQEGLLFNHKEKTITICGDCFDSIQEELSESIDKFLSEYKEDKDYFMSFRHFDDNTITK